MAMTNAERNKKWREAHPELAKERSLEGSKKWRAEHPEEARIKSTESTRKYRSENPEKVREYQREYRRAYRAKQKALKAAAENQAPQSPAKLSDQELENIYQGLKDKGLV